MRSIAAGSVLASLSLMVLVASVGAIAAGGQEPKRQEIRPSMRRKLEHA
jgi:hypothetical protein